MSTRFKNLCDEFHRAQCEMSTVDLSAAHTHSHTHPHTHSHTHSNTHSHTHSHTHSSSVGRSHMDTRELIQHMDVTNPHSSHHYGGSLPLVGSSQVGTCM
jgi:hypothetical protein